MIYATRFCQFTSEPKVNMSSFSSYCRILVW